MGVVAPTLVFGLLAIIPYIDFNPSRRAKDRRVALSIWLLGCAAFIILTWMGTPFYMVASPPAEEVVQLMLPVEGEGPVRALPWEQLQLGEWDTRRDVTDGAADSQASWEMRKLIDVYGNHIVDEHATAIEEAEAKVKKDPAVAEALANDEVGLPGGYGKMIVEEWQPGLKKVTMRVLWTPGGAEEKTFEKAFYIHDDANYDER
jgi:hypothetical protein